MGLVLADLLARADLVLNRFLLLARSLAPVWCLGLVATATLTWVGGPLLATRRSCAHGDNPWRQGLQLLSGAALGLASPFPLLSVIPGARSMLEERRARAFVAGFGLGSAMLSPAALIFGLAAMGPRLVALQASIGMLTACAAGAMLLCLRPEAVWATQPPPAPTKGSPLRSRGVGGYGRWVLGHFLSMAPHFLLALLVTAWVGALVPANAVARAFESLGVLAVPMAALLGAGVYQCPGTMPAVAELFAHSGLSAGALLAYATVGQLTTVRNLVGLGALLTPRGLGLLLGIAFLEATVVGWLVLP